MGKLIKEQQTEYVPSFELVRENLDPNKKYDYFITGIVMQAEVVNGNGRKYSLDDMRRAVSVYNESKVNKKMAWGELKHPNSAEVDLDRISHLITKLWMEGNDVYAECYIPERNNCSKIVRDMIDAGSPIPMSSR